MQLRRYIAILWRYWLLIVALPLAVGLFSLLNEVRQPQRYSAFSRILVTHEPLTLLQLDGLGSFPDFNIHHSWISSEFVLDDLPQVVTSRAFAQDVRALLVSQGTPIDLDDIVDGLEAERLHRTVTLTAQAASPEEAEALAGAAVEILRANGLKYWDRTTPGSIGLRIVLLDPVDSASALGSGRSLLLNVGLRVGLGLVAAIGLAFLLHYLDDTIRYPRQLEEWLGVEVVGVIPQEE